MMKRFGILFKKEFFTSAVSIKDLLYCFTVGYGIVYGCSARAYKSMYMYTSILGMMPVLLALIGGIQAFVSIDNEKKKRTGEMVLTTGVSLHEYILSKLISCIVHCVIAVILFYVIFSLAAGKIGTLGLLVYKTLYFILISTVTSIVYCSIAIMVRLTEISHKLIIGAFLLVVVAVAILYMVNSFIKIPVFSSIPELVVWFSLLVYGLICMCIGMKFLAVRDFVEK